MLQQCHGLRFLQRKLVATFRLTRHLGPKSGGANSIAPAAFGDSVEPELYRFLNPTYCSNYLLANEQLSSKVLNFCVHGQPPFSSALPLVFCAQAAAVISKLYLRVEEAIPNATTVNPRSS